VRFVNPADWFSQNNDPSDENNLQEAAKGLKRTRKHRKWRWPVCAVDERGEYTKETLVKSGENGNTTTAVSFQKI
jgi:hypothetical protein